MACTCIDTMNTAAAEHNTKLVATWMFRRDGEPTLEVATLDTEKVDKRNRRKVTLLPTFCPFCGTRYREATHD